MSACIHYDFNPILLYVLKAHQMEFNNVFVVDDVGGGDVAIVQIVW